MFVEDKKGAQDEDRHKKYSSDVHFEYRMSETGKCRF